MRVRYGLDEAEPRTEFSEERVGGVPAHRKAAAALRSVRCERRDDRLAAGLQRSHETVHVPPAISGVRQEVEHRAVVPQVHRTGSPIAGHVGFDPRDRRAWQSLLSTLERCSRDIENRHAADTARHQVIHEAGVPAPDVDHSTIRREAG